MLVYGDPLDVCSRNAWFESWDINYADRGLRDSLSVQQITAWYID